MSAAEVPAVLILNVGGDRSLLASRGLLLRSVGYLVESTCSAEDAMSRFREGDFDLVILCHSVSEQDRRRLIHAIRREGSSAPVLFVAAASEEAEVEKDADRTTESRPAALLQAIDETLRNQASLPRG